MRIFLSWAGEPSKHIAEAFFNWLPQVIQNLEPWMSTRMQKGDAWDGTIANELYNTPVGLICLTPESLNSSYLHYEAGAIANVKGAKVCTFLHGLKPAEVKHPLARFQHTILDKDDVYILLSTINAIVKTKKENYLSESRLRKALDNNWEELVVEINATPHDNSFVKLRSERDMIEEILNTVRNFSIGGYYNNLEKVNTLPQRALIALAKDFQIKFAIENGLLPKKVVEFADFLKDITTGSSFPIDGYKDNEIQEALTWVSTVNNPNSINHL